jgi:hypothetical protein
MYNLKWKNMKKTVYLLSLLTLVIVSFSSCSQDDGKSNRVEPKYITRLEANLILVHYLELIGDEYVLNISFQEAKELGVSAEMYINAQNEIRETNEFIKKVKSEPGNEIHLTDPQEALRSAKSGDIVEEKSTRGLPTLSGILQTSGQEEVRIPVISVHLFR